MIGNTYFVPDGSGGEHLYVVVGEHSGNVLLVNFTKHRTKCDTTCIVSSGDHPFIEHLSVVNYKDAVEHEREYFIGLKKYGHIRGHRNASDSLIAKIREGGKVCPFLAKKYLKYFD